MHHLGWLLAMFVASYIAYRRGSRKGVELGIEMARKAARAKSSALLRKSMFETTGDESQRVLFRHMGAEDVRLELETLREE